MERNFEIILNVYTLYKINNNKIAPSSFVIALQIFEREDVIDDYWVVDYI